VGGQTTSYTYDPVGQLTRVTWPDASYVGYEYDDAHRQKAVFDNRGNRIDYTLDNLGNRTAEAVKDPGGTLRRTLARSIDALGRIQQTTGRE
jgi:YD repeat-containing protein